MTWFRCPICRVEYGTAALADGCRAGHDQPPTGMFHTLGHSPGCVDSSPPRGGDPENISTLTAVDRHRISRLSPDRRSLQEAFQRSLRAGTLRVKFDQTDAPWMASEGSTPDQILPDPEGGWVPC